MRHGIIMMAPFVVLLVAFMPWTVSAHHEEPVIVEAEGQVTLGDDATIGQAKAAALNNARRAALEKAMGIEVRGSSMVYNFQLINDLVTTATKGVIVREKVLANTCRVKDEHLSCAAKIEAFVARLHEERRGTLSVTHIGVHRPDRLDDVRTPAFQSFDEVHIHAIANEDAYLYIFSVDQNGAVTKLYPNEYSKQEKTPAGREIVFPTDDQRRNGLRMKVRTPKGVKKSVESVLVVATKNKMDLLNDKTIEDTTITDLMRELSDIDPSLWTEKTVGYEVTE